MFLIIFFIEELFLIFLESVLFDTSSLISSDFIRCDIVEFIWLDFLDLSDFEF